MTFKTLLKCLFPLVLLLLSGAAAAAADMQVVRLPVASQGANEREAVLLQALEQAMQRLTGGGAAIDPVVTERLLAKPNRFVQQYKYEQRADGLELVVTVDLRGLARGLAAEGVPTWSPDRPPVLVWLALERGGERLLVGADGTDGVRSVLGEAAEDRGVRLMLPLLDAEDLSRVQVADLWGGFADPILDASGRYGTRTVLVGRIHSEAGQRVARWSLYTDAGGDSWRGSASTDNELLGQAMGELAQRLRPMYARLLRDEATQTLRLRVDGVRDLAAYTRLERYLQELAGVRSAQPLGVSADSVVFELGLSTDPRRVLGSLSRARLLAEVEAPPAAAEPAEESDVTGQAPYEHRYHLQVP
jgi:hypothetical protein